LSNNLVQNLGKGRKLIARISTIVGIFMLMGIVFLVFLQVVLRKVFNHPLTWPEEMVRILLVWVSFLGAYVALYYKQHLVLSVIVNRLTPVKTKTLLIITNFLVIAVLSIFLIWGFELIQVIGMIPMPTTGILNKYVYGVMWVSIFLMLSELIIQTWESIRSSV